MATGVVNFKFVRVGLANPTAEDVRVQVEWATANGLDAMAIRSPCVVDLKHRKICASQKVFEDGKPKFDRQTNEFVFENVTRPLAVDPPESIIRRG